MINKWIHLFLTILNVMPRWLQKLNSGLMPLALMCAFLMKVQDEKERNVKHNNFIKKYRLISKPVVFDIGDGKTMTMMEITIEKRGQK